MDFDTQQAREVGPDRDFVVEENWKARERRILLGMLGTDPYAGVVVVVKD